MWRSEHTMGKTLFSLFVLLFFVLNGCAASRTVKNNIFESSSPKLLVQASQEFTYFKNVTYVEHHRSLRGDRKLKNEVDTYYFFAMDPQKSHLIVKSVIVGISESEGIYAGDLFSSKKDLEHGIAVLSDENFEFSTKLASPVMPRQIAALLQKTGYILPKCILIKQFRKKDLDNRKQIKFIDYWEDATQSGYACNTWKDETSLVAGQKAHLKEFNKRVSESFKVLNTVK
jgi:hypothetical protein